MDVELTMQMLNGCCGNSDIFSLKSINYESDYISNTGQRAPPWRSALGELCYLLVDTHDVGNEITLMNL